jgi:exosortase E/protease (VPEID-CTERM system)
VTYAKLAAQTGLLALAVLVVLTWPDRATITEAWERTAPAHNWRASLLTNLALFAALLLATLGFSAFAAGAQHPPWLAFSGYCALLSVTGASLLLVAAPLAFWRSLIDGMPARIALALISAAFIVLMGRLSLAGWGVLSGTTLHVAHYILSLYEPNVVLDADRKLLGADGFDVLVLKECSGYEGVGLVASFLAVYCVFMRKRLRFPHALLLFPIGIVAVWLLNCVRIAALVSIGAHASAIVALDGFHSQAGWLGFLMVAMSTMGLSQKLAFFRPPQTRAQPAQSPLLGEPQVALLAPFAVLMAATVVASLFAPYDRWLYGLKVAGGLAVLWYFRRAYLGQFARVAALSVGVGLVIGLGWGATDPAAANTSLAAWLATLSPGWRAAWLTVRALGMVLIVPIAEEFAFRGYLQRALIDRNFTAVPQKQFTWFSFLTVNLLFGLMHQRWIEAALAGAAYSLITYRTGRLGDAVAAHMATNAVILIWALVAWRMSLL